MHTVTNFASERARFALADSHVFAGRMMALWLLLGLTFLALPAEGASSSGKRSRVRAAKKGRGDRRRAPARARKK
jgi:hypothetical protein